MDRQRRASEEENAIWRDPCHYNTTNSGGLYESKAATKVAQQAKNVLQKAKAYSGLFAKLHSFDKFDDLLKEWKEDWLRKFPWFIEEVLPENKILFKTADEGEIHKMMDSIDSHLPVMYKALKMIVASLHKLSESLKDDGISDDQVLAERVKETMDDVRAVLCYFYDLMKARNIEILPVYDSEVPEINKVNKMDIALYIYRDTLNYLEYVTQVFQIMAESDLPTVV